MQIFLNYRHTDTGHWAAHIHDGLREELPDAEIFLDVGGDIPIGSLWWQFIRDQISRCDMMLCLIGPKWSDGFADRSADHEPDYVALEISLALFFHIPIIPILVGGANVPDESSLPQDIKALLSFQSATVRKQPFVDEDIRALARKLLRGIDLSRATRSTTRARLRKIKIDAAVSHGTIDGLFEPGAGRIQWFQDHPAGPEMVVVPAGKFIMGGETDGQDVPWTDGRTLPRRSVTIHAPFAVGRFAVTYDEWEAIYREDGVAVRPAAWFGRGKMPVVHTSWERASGFVACLSRLTSVNYRLLSEAEWEYCCRAGTTTAYSFGSDVSAQQARFEQERPLPVDAFTPNPWGLYQMHGNVWEWCADRWHPNYEGAPTDGSPWTVGTSNARVVRGGSWASNRILLRSTYRDTYEAGSEVGFRVARDL